MAQLENFRLKVFRAVAEQLNFRKAAEHLFLTQPAITLQIKALENDLGVRLFDRTAGKISLTRQGSVLLTYANRLAELVSEAERELQTTAKSQENWHWEPPQPSHSTLFRGCSELSSERIPVCKYRCTAVTPPRLSGCYSMTRFRSD